MNQQFSWQAWIGGFLLTVAAGAILNFPAGIVALSVKHAAISALIGGAPGLLLAFMSRFSWHNGFSQGALTGAIVMTIIGTICGASLSGARIGG